MVGELAEMNELSLRGLRRSRVVVASPTLARASSHIRTRRRKLKTVPRVTLQLQRRSAHIRIEIILFDLLT